MSYLKRREAPQRSGRIKTEVNFFSSSGIGTERVNFDMANFLNSKGSTVPFLPTVAENVKVYVH